MPAVCVVGSADSGHDGFCSGVVSTGQPGLTVNGVPVAGNGDMSMIHIKPDTPPHVGVIVANSLLTVNGVPIAKVGDVTACGAAIVSGNSLFTIE
ncbi:PAAR domain-containing protein [Vibrio marisflavi]|uniref:PaaR repeat-containing protein n=1 Tax=Vibrio marisflavi CECT 7928 TaxID=634439 RepID=A0ABN8EDQ9_9VIBR|nr:PAAR domain-containing protein [Vibrio marisflavi]CAH0543019.1 hypothetical protein VMF7928_04363 [Vibrio marisflavi CECT 7928]